MEGQFDRVVSQFLEKLWRCGTLAFQGISDLASSKQHHWYGVAPCTVYFMLTELVNIILEDKAQADVVKLRLVR